ncbi:MAG: NAD(P)/FAD-dependent oxidoreductase [Armatimonas sp.]
MDLYDFTIIGGGPTGLYGAFYAGLRQMRTKIIDSMPQLGGQLAALYPEKYIYDIGGFPKVYAKDFVAGCIEQAMQYEPTVCLNESVLTLDRAGGEGNDGYFVLTTTQGVHLTKTLLIAGGVGAFTPRKLNLEGLEPYEGNGLFYSVSNVMQFLGKNLVIVGGGDSAFDWAMALGPGAEACVQIHRSDRFKAHEDSIQKVMEGGHVDLRTFHEVRSVQGDGKVEEVTIFDNRTDQEHTVPCDALLLNLGFETNLGPIKEWGLEFDKRSIIVDSTMRTNIEGVWAAGDICTFPGKLKLIATGMGEAGTAANFAKNYIDPKARAFPGHSSERS